MKQELKFHTRREFLRTTILGGAVATTVPSFVANTFGALDAAAKDAVIQTETGRDGTILVVLQMAGGNDGLNTVVPFTNDYYRKARPRLALAANDLAKINDTLGFNPELSAFKSLYDAGHLSIVQGVGYPNPNRSHFRSTDIWATASDANKYEKHGWIGRYFDAACAGADPTVGVAVGRQMPLAFTGKNGKGVSLENPQNYRFVSPDSRSGQGMDATEKSFRKLNQSDDRSNSGDTIEAAAGSTMRPPGSPLDFLERTAMDAQISSDKIRAVSNVAQNKADYPPSQLANSLKLVARLIAGGLPTRVYYVSQGGYDTHTQQEPAQQRLLRELGDSVKAFVEDLKAQGNFERVLLMTFSEFGRRVAENGNAGTDHGAASSMFVVGNKIKAGLLGTYPSLAPADLTEGGDLKFTVDFRSVYAGVLEQWLKTKSDPVLGKKFTPLQIA
jgi:uncharacterized protein (DUF1501 family)